MCLDESKITFIIYPMENVVFDKTWNIDIFYRYNANPCLDKFIYDSWPISLEIPIASNAAWSQGRDRGSGSRSRLKFAQTSTVPWQRREVLFYSLCFLRLSPKMSRKYIGLPVNLSDFSPRRNCGATTEVRSDISPRRILWSICDIDSRLISALHPLFSVQLSI